MVLTKEDFTHLTIVELLQNIWGYVDSIKNIERAKYWFWLPRYKNWCKELLKEKWSPSLPKFEFVLKNVNDLNLLFCPGAPADTEKFIEFLVRPKVIKRKTNRNFGRELPV